VVSIFRREHLPPAPAVLAPAQAFSPLAPRKKGQPSPAIDIMERRQRFFSEKIAKKTKKIWWFRQNILFLQVK